MREGDVVGRPVLAAAEVVTTPAMLKALRTMAAHRVHLRRVIGKDHHASHCFWAYYEVHGIELPSLGRVRERTVGRLQRHLLVTKGYDTAAMTGFGRKLVDRANQQA